MFMSTVVGRSPSDRTAPRLAGFRCVWRGCLGLLLLAGLMSPAVDEYEPPLQTAALPTGTASASTPLNATILDEAGRQLSRVAAAVKSSVVHIESRRSGRNGAVEETGSGVVITSQRFG